MQSSNRDDIVHPYNLVHDRIGCTEALDVTRQYFRTAARFLQSSNARRWPAAPIDKRRRFAVLLSCFKHSYASVFSLCCS